MAKSEVGDPKAGSMRSEFGPEQVGAGSSISRNATSLKTPQARILYLHARPGLSGC